MILANAYLALLTRPRIFQLQINRTVMTALKKVSRLQRMTLSIAFETAKLT